MAVCSQSRVSSSSILLLIVYFDLGSTICSAKDGQCMEMTYCARTCRFRSTGGEEPPRRPVHTLPPLPGSQLLVA